VPREAECHADNIGHEALTGLIGVVALVWLGLWLQHTGLLVSSANTAIPKTRECKYFIGVSVVRRIEPLAIAAADANRRP